MKLMEAKKTFLLGFLALIFIISSPVLFFSYEKEIKNISLAMAESITNAGMKTIAVVDFTDLQGNVTELGRFLAEELSVALASAGKGFEVVDRTHLKTLLQEHKLSSSGLIDPQTARKLGEIAGVEALVTGSITPFGDSVRLTVKTLNTNTAKMIGASSADIPRTKAIEDLLAKGIGESAAPTTTPSQPAASQQQVAKSVTKVEIKNFTSELQKCKLSGTTLTCYFLITNNEKDRRLFLSHSRVIDEFGNEIKSSRMQLGDESSTSPLQAKDLASGIPIKGSATFENVSPDVTSIALLELTCYSEYLIINDQLKIQFRNIPIIK
jgi:TolB-like protein